MNKDNYTLIVCMGLILVENLILFVTTLLSIIGGYFK